MIFRSGDGPTTQIGYVNANQQKCHGTLGVFGTDHNQYAYRLECLRCGYVYGANGSDIAARLCPQCQGGAEGIQYWLPDISPKAFKLSND
jgi:hypothetical protein